MNKTIYNIFAFARIHEICFSKILILQSLVLFQSCLMWLFMIVFVFHSTDKILKYVLFTI